MVIDDLINIAKEGGEDLKVSAMTTALYMVRDGCSLSGDIGILVKFFLDEVQDEKLGALLCDVLALNYFDNEFAYEVVEQLSKYASNSDWGKNLLLSMEFDETCLEGYIQYAKALYKVGAEEESKSILYEAVEAFDAPNISIGIRIMVEENFPVDFINLYDSYHFDEERLHMA